MTIKTAKIGSLGVGFRSFLAKSIAHGKKSPYLCSVKQEQGGRHLLHTEPVLGLILT